MPPCKESTGAKWTHFPNSRQFLVQILSIDRFMHNFSYSKSKDCNVILIG